MHWVVNTDLKRETGYVHLVEQLKRSGTPFTIVRKPPFADYLIGEGEDHTPITLDLSGPVFVTGTTSMNLVSQRHGWSPGYITAPSQETLLSWWGDELLNHDAVMGPLRSVEPPCEEFFIRPVEDTKSFAGTTMTHTEFEQWRQVIIDGGNDFVTLSGDDAIMLAPLKKIYAEYRTFVVCGLVVTASRYKMGSRVINSNDVDKAVLDYAQRRRHDAESALSGIRGIALYAGPRDPRLTFALDIADTPDGLKVIETNSISSSGFYACDMGKFVNAINWLS